MPVNLPILKEFHPVPGLEIGFANAGIKQTKRPDLVLFKLSDKANVAGIFTLNAFCAAPVQICKLHLAEAKPKCLIVNTGNANAGTGEQGFQDALKVCGEVADLLSININEVLPFSTGVIGEPLPMDKILKALPGSKSSLAEDSWYQASMGIMTTDTQPKGYSKQFEIDGVNITISGISKGAGMIMPNMATMLGYIATDAPIDKSLLQKWCSELGDRSFNRITVDGDTSTNDSCMLMATGEAQIPEIVDEASESAQLLKEELKLAFDYLAQAIVRDGEGATKFVTINVMECQNQKEALRIGYTVAHSPLVKTALFASDANWGRILAAVGRSGVKNMDLNAIQIYLDDVCIVRDGGRAKDYTEAAGAAVLKQDELAITVKMGRGDATETIWTTDLSHDYVSINADYRS